MEVQMFSSSLGAMGSLLGKLRPLLVSPGDQLPEPLKPQDKLELLKQDLEEIHTLLMDLSRVEAPKTMAKLWMNQVRELSYDIEDCIDKMMHPPSNTGEENRFDVEEFNTLMKQASDARKRYHRYDLGRWASNPTFRVVNRLVWVPTMDLVGIGDSRANLINLLSNEAEKLMKVISVLGPVGVGKTTLAKEVYRQMRGQFKCRAFVRASKTPDTRRLLRSIISQIQRHQQPPHGLPVQELIDYIRKHLQQKRYFIIIDGLWETISWDIVNGAFPEGIDCSRILITTDFEEVALECSDYQSDCIFKMEPLSRNNSRELFLNRLFGSKHECTEQLKDVSEKIIEKCGGLPLATICIASILASQSDNSELWLHVNECLSSFIRKNLTSEGMLSEIVGMSYNSLSDHLKTCLLYLSMYPEGYTFLKTDLVKQWMAEGFISAVEGKDTGEVAEFYFDELVCRGLILPNCIGFSDEDIFYTVHSTVFEVIRCKSMEENFATVIDYSEAITKLSAKVRRLSLTFSSAKYATKPDGIALSELRSLTFYGLVNCLPSIMEFKLLRVLILEFWGDKEELDIIGINKLFQLRYLRIRTDMTVKLPASMQELLCLETLEMYARVMTFPSDAFVLPRLLHLCLHDVINVPEGIGHMRSLRTLQCFDLSRISNGIVWSLNEMTNLRDLRLTCTTASREHHLKSNLIALISCIEKLGNLKTMILAPSASCTSINLCCSGIVSSLPISLGRLELLPPICIFSRLPLCMGQLQKLRILKIVLGELTGSDIYSIGRLQELTILSLYVRQPTVELIVVNRAAFPVLKCFKLRCAIMRLAFQADAMPGLQRLKLEFNAHSGEQNGNMLAGIEHLLNLQEVTGRIGAAPGAEESDRVAAESVFKDAISKHSRLISFNLRIVHSVDQEIPQFADTPESCSGSDKTLNCSSISDGISEVHEVDPVQELLPFNNASSTDNILLLRKYQMAPVGEEAAWTWATLLQPIPPGYGCQEQPSDGNTAAFSMPFQMTSSDVTTAIASHHVVGSNTLSECRSSDDGYSWRKYGQKLVKGIREQPRSYYRCTFPNCPTKKRVERSALDGQIIEIVYNGMHNHDKPQNTSRGGSSTAAQPMESGGSEAFEGKFGGMSGRNDEVGVSSPRAGNSEFDEHKEDFKRLRKDNEGEGISMSGSRTTMVREPRVAFVTRSAIDILDDGFRWRKYGKKMVKENPYPRSYYKCLMAGCSVRKHVERVSRDPSIVITTYKGKHNHGPLYPPPAMANQSSGAGQQQHAHGFGGQGWKGVSSSASGQGTVGGSFVASTPDGVELELTPRVLAKEEPKEDALSRCSPSILEHEENQEASIYRSADPYLHQSSEMANLQSQQSLVSTLPKQLPATFMKEITSDFAAERELGRSVFGIVYKGDLPEGGTIAVKRLAENAPVVPDKTFDFEVTKLMVLQHDNIVQLVGYCHEAQKKLVQHNGRYVFVDMVESCLCHKYLPKGTLDKYLYADTRSINWDTQFQIVKGICQGLHFLHKELDGPLIHMNLVPNSIWLDDNWVPKIANFGLSRLFGEEADFLASRVNGYMAPEYLYRGEISTMLDIYSLGMLILAITTGEKNCAVSEDRSARLFVDNVHQNWKTNEQIIYKYPSLNRNGLQQVKACIVIGLKCVEVDLNRRPSITDIVDQLNGKRVPIFEQITELNILERIVAGREEPRHLDLPLLDSVTESFSENRRIGQGGCGEVYKGILRNADIAVKKLFNNCTIKDKMFHREVTSLITVRHQNIVRLLGYCSFTEEHAIPFNGKTYMAQVRERLLCLEYISNGSLERHLTDELRGLEWCTRFDIIVGICNGLCYLHKEKNIIHMDLKPANILVDDWMVPKITDFGLSRLHDNPQATTTTSRLISPGYSAPEYCSEGKSSLKSDIYSLGVIILELVSGSKNNPNITKAQVLRKWRHRWIKSSKHKSSKHAPLGYQQVTKCIDLAQKCMEHDPADRPDISDIVQELNEIDSNDHQFQVIPSLEDMLGIEPLEIQFPFEHYWQVSHKVELSNDTDDHFAFVTKPSLHRLRTEPDKGIVPPRSNCSVSVTMMQAQVMALLNNRYKEKITVLSTRVDGGLSAMDITKGMFMEEEGKVVDEVNVMVVLGRPPLEEES